MRTINEIVVHCTATRPTWMEGLPDSARIAQLRKWHVEDNGWRDVGYHFLISRDGAVHIARPIAQAGAHEPKVNKTSIGVALFGGFGSTENDDPEQHYTDAQLHALRNLIEELKLTYVIKKVTGHNQYAAKACPGFNVPRWYAAKPPARNLAQQRLWRS
jgi:N-acetylmuramoyl-L-alanine amidase